MKDSNGWNTGDCFDSENLYSDYMNSTGLCEGECSFPVVEEETATKNKTKKANGRNLKLKEMRHDL
jgi:hypothetical protein